MTNQRKPLSNDMINGITFTIILGVIVAGITFWLTTLA